MCFNKFFVGKTSATEMYVDVKVTSCVAGIDFFLDGLATSGNSYILYRMFGITKPSLID